MKAKRQYWSKEDINKLIELYPVKPYEELLAAFPTRSLICLVGRANRLGLVRKIPNWVSNKHLWLCDFDLGFLVGFTEGEGCIGACITSSGAFVPYMFWANTILRLIEKVQELLPGLTVIHFEHQRPKRWKRVYKASLRNQDNIRQVLEFIEPHLIGKRRQAQLVLELLNLKIEYHVTHNSHKRGGKVRSDELKQKLIDICLELRELNKRGNRSIALKPNLLRMESRKNNL